MYDRPIHKLCLIATKEELNSMTSLYNLVKANLFNAKKLVAQSITLVISFPHLGRSVLHSALLSVKAWSRYNSAYKVVLINSHDDSFLVLSDHAALEKKTETIKVEQNM